MSLAPGTTSPVDTLDHEHHEHHEHHDLRMHQPPQRPCSPPTSPRLYTKASHPPRRQDGGGPVTAFFTLWANDVHSLGNYGFARLTGAGEGPGGGASPELPP